MRYSWTCVGCGTEFVTPSEKNARDNRMEHLGRCVDVQGKVVEHHDNCRCMSCEHIASFARSATRG